MPSRKWIVAQVTALGALLTMWTTTAGWDQEETVALIGLVVQAVSTFLIPNAPDKAGVTGQGGQP